MPFTFTYQPINKIAGVAPKQASFETAAECLKSLHGMELSDERITDITAPSGRRISKRELELMAADEGKS